MNKVSGRLQVFFEGAFWIGVFEQVVDGKLSACKVTFGEEPKDHEIQEFILKNYEKLPFSPFVDTVKEAKERMNPKRLQREVKKQMTKVGIGTKSQQALKLQHELGKMEKKTRSREQKEAEKLVQFERKQQKRKEKHKGR
ncbi:hypothetical protein C8E03_103162 [Lachnotalea glycerini]|uniref:DUF2992 family protein n=1 Tax=Lachnotalea glycerini TaxID=1763509 RepID=A0A255IJK8_9FIRM|nr:YjdF family protein [Lachnotalea glycerini]PXV91605.1 hypothetical protein C8E03_103162 [Lachnotalea glycerini]RDY30045.1 DUF2992 family protein [Lachnotalea glycerini]